jgi:hypothetical protein
MNGAGRMAMRRIDIIGAMIMASIATGAVGQEPVSAGFCARAGATMGMTLATAKEGPVWRKPLLGLGASLFGGSSSVMMAVSPVDGAPAGAADYQRLQKVCLATRKGMNCTVEGPMMLTVSIKGVDHALEARPGERADFRMAGSRLECIDRPPAA